MSQVESEPEWKKLKLSFERPYKDDSGKPIPLLYDLTPEGQFIYEPKETSTTKLEANLRRIFLERGSDFFEKNESAHLGRYGPSGVVVHEDSAEEPSPEEPDSIPKSMTMEELYKMKSEILPQLFVALGEMSHARDLLNSILSGSQSASILSGSQGSQSPADSTLLSATLVTKPPPIISVQAFNAQLTIGSKDEALRKAAGLFKSAAESMERSRLKGEKYWVDALRIRRANWGLTPAPLPMGSTTGKGADKTSKDFIISYGLEGCTNAQTEFVDQEIFSLLVKEAGNLPTASARVSERLIAIDAAHGLELTFELVDSANSTSGENICELIYYVLRVFLLRKHSITTVDKGTDTTKIEQVPYFILQPIIDLLQYRVFCERVEVELQKVVQALNAAGIPSTLSFTGVGESGHHIVSLLSDARNKVIGGEAVIRIDDWNTLWFTFVSPSTLTAHLAQATLTVSSLPQLSQLLMDEVERCLLQRICGLGRELCDIVGGIWFIDLNRCVARWDGCVLNFKISYGENLNIGCSAFRLDGTTGSYGYARTYVSGTTPLLTWVEEVIRESARQS
ncbi:subunit 17 of mediator complex-domain-containing protein [Pholiota molesta]|nr:subunit 17 of mediator complex-domain-containing protein [Pholiota molesta]